MGRLKSGFLLTCLRNAYLAVQQTETDNRCLCARNAVSWSTVMKKLLHIQTQQTFTEALLVMLLFSFIFVNANSVKLQPNFLSDSRPAGTKLKHVKHIIGESFH